MHLKYQKYIDVAINEIIHKEFGTTQQYLWVHEVEYENNLPKVQRIEDEYYWDDIIAIFFPIKDVWFFLEIHVTKSSSKVHSVYIESWNKIYLTAISDTLSYEELIEWLHFEWLEWWSKWGVRQDWKSNHTFSRVSFEPIKNEAYDFNFKLFLLLNELEKNSEAIKQLSNKVDYIAIEVRRCQYIWNGNIWESLTNEEIKRLANLNVSLDIDIYIEWIPFE